jgi:hypothetical protein
MMKDLPGPAICKKCATVSLSWKKLSCSHLLCHACLQRGIADRNAEIIQETKLRSSQTVRNSVCIITDMIAICSLFRKKGIINQFFHLNKIDIICFVLMEFTYGRG